MTDNKTEFTHSTTITTADWYEKEKEMISLKSSHRPYHFNTINIAFRQTKFPDQSE